MLGLNDPGGLALAAKFPGGANPVPKDDVTGKVDVDAKYIAKLKDEAAVQGQINDMVKASIDGFTETGSAMTKQSVAVADLVAKKQALAAIDGFGVKATEKQKQQIIEYTLELRHRQAVESALNTASGMLNSISGESDKQLALNDAIKDGAAAVDRINDAYERRAKIMELVGDLTDKEKEKLAGVIQKLEIRQGALSQQKMIGQYAQNNPDIQAAGQYKSSIQQANSLFTEGEIDATAYGHAISVAAQQFQDFQEPLTQYKKQLQEQHALNQLVGRDLQVATELQRQHDVLQARGWSEQQIADKLKRDNLKELLIQSAKEAQTQQEKNQIYSQTAGALETLVARYNAVAQAASKYDQNGNKQDPLLSGDQASAQIAQINAQQSTLKVDAGKGSGKDVLNATLGGYIKDFKGMATGIQDIFTNAFNTIADGAANAFARAIVYGEGLGKALKNVARSALAEIISGFIKLGIQWLIMKVIGDAMSKHAISAATSTGSAVAAAWAPAAAAVSVATMGAADAAGIVGMTAANAVSQAFAHIKFATGGEVPGTGNRDTVHVMLTPGEFVVNKNAVQALGLSALHMINQQRMPKYNNGGLVFGSHVSPYPRYTTTSSNAAMRPNINIIHDGSTNVELQSYNEDAMTLVAKRVSEATVADKAPHIMAQELDNPNGRFTKKLGRNFDLRPRR
jgi:hypothetical protein